VSPTLAPTKTPVYDPAFTVLNLVDGSVLFSMPTALNCNGVYRDDDESLFPYHAYVYVTCGGEAGSPGTLYTFSAINAGGWAGANGKYVEKYALVDQQPLPSMARMGSYIKATRTLYIGVPALPSLAGRPAQSAAMIAFVRQQGRGTPPDTTCFGMNKGITKGGAVGVTFIITACLVGIGTYIFHQQKNAPGPGPKPNGGLAVQDGSKRGLV
jgi:hypothetical protein